MLFTFIYPIILSNWKKSKSTSPFTQRELQLNVKTRNNCSSNLQPSPPVMTIHLSYKELYEQCFPPLLTIQIYHVDSKTTGTFTAKKRSFLCHFLFNS
ncbi:hypothetical protein OCD93_09855 [Bacillus toyonensis]|nr:hypothetical protein [Bacillus toyonensis]